MHRWFRVTSPGRWLLMCGLLLGLGLSTSSAFVLFGRAHRTVTEEPPAPGFYVSKTGSDSNPCTASQRCLTIARGMSMLTSAGAVLHIGAGTYNENLVITSVPANGTSWSNLTTIRGEGTAVPILRGPAGENGINIASTVKQYLLFQQLEIDASLKSGSNYGMRIINASAHLRFQDMIFHDAPNQNVWLSDGANDIQFIGGASYRSGYNPNGCHGRTGACCDDGYCHGFYLQTGSFNIRIERMRIYDNNGLGVQCYCDDLHVENSVFYDNNGFAGVLVGDGGDDPQVLNCTFHRAGGVGIAVDGGQYTGTGYVRNNVVYHGDSDMLRAGGIPQSNNILRLLSSNPGFVNADGHDYHISSNSSVLVNAGHSSAPSVDLEGNARPLCGTPDVGAYEWTGTCP